LAPSDHEGVEKSGHNRAINRHRWHYPDLLEHLDNPHSTHARVFKALKALLKLRSEQAAFHPNATQFTLQLGEQLFGFWRQSLDRSQSIFAIHNLTAEAVSIPAMSLNLIGGEIWTDLISGDDIGAIAGDIAFAPYQCRWITN
jgi:sucrose phosphorylase